MEEEITKVSLSRYKVELDQKQRYLKTSQKYEEQLRDLRACLSLIVHTLDIKHSDIPDFLKNPQFQEDTIEGLRNLIHEGNRELSRLVTAIDRKILQLHKKKSGNDENLYNANLSLIPANKPLIL